MKESVDAYLVLRRIRVENLNLVGSAITWGFPPPMAFLGFSHALERQLRKDFDIRCLGIAIVNHQFSPQVSSPAGKRSCTFNLTRNPLIYKNGKIQAAPIVEEGRGHAEISLAIALSGDDATSDTEALKEKVEKLLPRLRIAGGSIRWKSSAKNSPVQIFSDFSTDEAEERTKKKLLRSLLPGFALTSCPDKLTVRLDELKSQQKEGDLIEAFLDIAGLNHEPPDASVEDDTWKVRKEGGWLVPLPLGYQALSPIYEPGVVPDSRDATVPFQFVECVCGIGEWRSPHRVKELDELFWTYNIRPDQGLYLAQTANQI